MKKIIVDPEREFLVVRHSYLNGNGYDPVKTIEDTKKLEVHLNGRKVVVALEGDVLPVRGSDEIVLTHQNFFAPSMQQFQELCKDEIASSLDAVLEKAAQFHQNYPDERLVLSFEAKYPTNARVLGCVVKKLEEYKLDDFFFDTHYGNILDFLTSIQSATGRPITRSLNLWGHVGRIQFQVSKPMEYDILTCPHPMSFGKLREPVIYGSVGTLRDLQMIAENPMVYGCHLRLKEGGGIKGAIKKFYNSVTNTAGLRRITV